MPPKFCIMDAKPDSRGVTKLTAEDLHARLRTDEPPLVIDVREPDEYEGWHIAGSKNTPLGDLLADERPDVPPGQKAVLVCRGGARAERARAHLSNLGIDAAVLEGGMLAWNGIYETANVPGAPDGAEVVQFRRVGKGCLSYMVVQDGKAAVIDATIDISTYMDAARERGADIVAVLDTHAHADHVSGARLLADATGANYHAPDEVGEVPHVSVKDGAFIKVGGAELQPVATPGHTPGSFTYLIGNIAFTGDTLFVESVGRPDLGQDPREKAPTLWRTLHEKLLALPPDTMVAPGHHGDTAKPEFGEAVAATLSDIKADVSALGKSEPDFVEWVAANTLPKPENFDVIKKINVGKTPMAPADELRELEAGANRCAVSG